MLLLSAVIAAISFIVYLTDRGRAQYIALSIAVALTIIGVLMYYCIQGIGEQMMAWFFETAGELLLLGILIGWLVKFTVRRIKRKRYENKHGK